MSDALAPLHRLLAEADSLANGGNIPAAMAKCQEVSTRVMQLSQECHNQPQLRTEADALFAKLKSTVGKLKKLEKSKGNKKGALVVQIEMDDAVGFHDDNPFSESNIKAQMFREQQDLKLMQARENETSKLAQEMIDLEEIFRKLNELVVEQGEQVNLIEDHVNETVVRVEEGAKQLEDAVVNKRSSRKKKIIIICSVVAAALVLALVLYLILSKVL